MEKSEAFIRLLSLIPKEPDWNINWNGIEDTELESFIEQMKKTWQNPEWHGEGDVWTHTQMVCETLLSMPEFRSLEESERQEVFLAALLHDIGKIPCTREENGLLISPNHTSVGARMARELFWSVYGLCGDETSRRIRETICSLIRYHSVPLHILDQRNPERRLLKAAANGELTEDFSIALLCLLSEADVRGRIYAAVEDSVENVRLCRELAEDIGCLHGPYDFSSDYAKYAYFSGRIPVPSMDLYDDTWGEVVLLSGLPGTGKDTWIREHYSKMPVVSLDDLRRQMKISPRDDQGIVIQAAREQAKEYLRKKQSFVWNATNLTPMIRGKQIGLFTDYGASVKIEFLETGFKEQLLRNESREAEVPDHAIRHMLRNLILPERCEAHRVLWYCV